MYLHPSVGVIIEEASSCVLCIEYAVAVLRVCHVLTLSPFTLFNKIFEGSLV
jgi:hypothetical protein